MNEKEKKAIIYFDDILTNKCDIEFWKRIKNLIKKQQERIEKLTTTLFHYEDTLERYEYKVFNGNVIDLEKVKELDKIRILGKEYISKDKIRKKIEELCKELLKYPFEDEWFLRDRIEEQIDLLKELLEEN